MRLLRYLVFLVCLLWGEIEAQNTIYTNRIVSEFPISSVHFTSFFNSNSFDGRSYAYIKLSSIPTTLEKQEAELNGIKFLEYIPHGVYLLSLPTNAESLLYLSQHKYFVSNIIFENDKLSDNIIHRLAPLSNTSKRNLILYVYCQDDIDIIKFSDFANEWGVVLSASQTFHRIKLSIREDKLLLFSSNAAVKIIDWPQPIPVTDNLPGKTNHRSSTIGSSLGRNLRGDSVVLGEWDGEGVGAHLDIDTPRVTRMNAFINNGNGQHATHVCGTMAGAGNINPYALGMAPNAKVFSWNFYGDIISQMDSGVRFNNVMITQNSYGYGDADDSCKYRGRYDDVSHDLDILVRNHPNLIHVFAAGNSQSLCGLGGYRTVFSGFQSAKNIISVGALTDQDAMSSFSSWGPVRDGRIKPEVCAVGVNVYSTQNGNLYAGGWNGTSMACPGTSGTLAQLVQRYHQLNSGNHPQASLMRVILANSADDVLNVGPDFKSGFGRINALTAVKAIEQNRYKVDSVSNGNLNLDSILVGFGLQQLKFALAWSDKEAAILASKALVNDLDLYIITPANDTIRPWVLDTQNRSSLAVRGIDSVNNIEQVTIDAPSQGYYKIIIAGRSVPFGPQIYAYTYERVAKAITMVFPNGGEMLTPLKNYIIKWDAAGVGSTCNIDYTLDDGATWTAMATGVSVTLKNYNWSVPNAISNQARIRITAGAYVDKSDSTFTIGAVIDSIKGVTCDKQVTLKWKKVTGAAGYNVMQYNNGTMQSVGQTIDTFYTVRNLTNGVKYWFSIRCKFGNFYGERAIAAFFTPTAAPLPPEVTLQPTVQPLCSGTLVTLKSKSIGTATVLQQWQVSIDTGKTFVNIPLATDTVFSFMVNTSMNNYRIRCYFYNSCQNFQYTDTLKLLVDTTLKFTKHPMDMTVCSGGTAQFHATAPSQSVSNYQWQYNDGTNGWLDLVDSIRPDLILPGVAYSSNGWSYRMKASNTCSSNILSDSAILTVKAPLALTATGGTTICLGVNASLSAVGTGGDTAKYTFEWQLNGVVLQRSHSPVLMVSPTVLTNYKVFLWDSCSSTGAYDSVSLDVLLPLSITANSYIPLCKGNSASLTAIASGGNGNYTYGWLAGTTLFQYSKVNSVSVTPTTTTTYKVFVTDSCTLRQDTASIIVYVRPGLHVTRQVNPDTVCIGAQATITASGSGGDSTYTYTFIDANNNFILQSGLNNQFTTIVNPNNNYILVLVDSCTAINDTLKFKIPMRSKLSVTTSKSPSTNVCANALVQLNATPFGGVLKNYTYQWRLSGSATVIGTTKQITVSTPVTARYVVTLKDGCTIASASDSITVYIEKPNPLFSNSYSNGQDYAFFMAEQSGYKSYLWHFGDGDTTSEFQPNHRYKTKGSYKVCLKIQTFTGCDSEYCDTVVIYFNNGIRGTQINRFSVSPNPFQDQIYLTFQAVTPLKLILFDALGREVESRTSVEPKTHLNTEMLAPGNYMMKLIYKDEVDFVRLIKQ